MVNLGLYNRVPYFLELPNKKHPLTAHSKIIMLLIIDLLVTKTARYAR